MSEQTEFEEAVDFVGDAFALLVAVAFTSSATVHESVKKVESVLSAMHGTLTRCAIESAQKREVGNGAKMLSALKAIVDVFDSKEPMSQQERDLVVYNLAKNALSAPPRNCDRFNTLEDALAGWREVSPDESGPFDNWLFAEAKGDAK